MAGIQICGFLKYQFCQFLAGDWDLEKVKIAFVQYMKFPPAFSKVDATLCRVSVRWPTVDEKDYIVIRYVPRQK